MSGSNAREHLAHGEFHNAHGGVSRSIINQSAVALLDNTCREDHVGHEAVTFKVFFGHEDLAATSENSPRLLQIEQEQPTGVSADVLLGFAFTVAVIKCQPPGFGLDWRCSPADPPKVPIL